jgi:membrane-bound acyltransferase YfiQ involved in biofilm formation
MAQSPAAVNNARFIIQASKGLVRDHRARRTLMFYNVLTLLVLMFLGSTLLWSWLREHPLLFIGYWGFCAWLTILAILLALYDMAKIRLDAKRARRQLEEEYLRAHNKNGNTHDSHTP